MAFMSSWNGTDDSKKTLALLVSRLQMEENMLKLADTSISEGGNIAYFANKGKTGRSTSSNVATNPSSSNLSRQSGAPRSVCGECKSKNRRSDHREEDCWVKQAYQGKKDSQQGADTEALLAVSQDQGDDQDAENGFAFKSSEVELGPDSWYVDSGASSHMTDRRDFFHVFQSTE